MFRMSTRRSDDLECATGPVTEVPTVLGCDRPQSATPFRPVCPGVGCAGVPRALLVYLRSASAEKEPVRLSEDDVQWLVGHVGSLPQPLQSHAQELIDNPEAFQRRVAAIEIAVGFYSATLMAVLDNNLDLIETLTAPLRSLDEPTRLAVGEALQWWTCSDEQTRADYLQRQQVIVNEIAHRLR